MFIYALIGAIVGVCAGTAIAWLLVDSRRRAQISSLQTDLALCRQRAESLEAQAGADGQTIAALRDTGGKAEQELAAARAQLQATHQNLLEQRKLLDDAQSQLRDAFASVSAEALARNNEAFLQLARERFATLSAEAAGSLDQRKTQIEGLLLPLRQLIDQYQLRVGEIEKSRVESYSMLREQLGTLAETHRALNLQTKQLVGALSRPNVRGQWGEISLRRLIELAGLSNRCDFVEQASVDTEDGRQRPDMIIHLPAQRDVIVDCKVSLDAFLDALAASDDAARKTNLQRHAQQVRQRARELSAKSYWSQFRCSPEFVIMFMPGEACLYAALEQDPLLLEECLKNQVVMATPTTLIALLKAIEFGWRQQAVTENAEQIRLLGMELYDRIAVAMGHVGKIGANLASTVGCYNQAIASLESRVLVTARKMSDLGARSDKEIPDLQSIDKTPREISANLLPAQSDGQ